MRTHLLLAILGLMACNTASDSDTGADGVVDTYAFAGRNGADSVGYSGQVFRQVLIHDMSAHIAGLTTRIDSGWFPVEGDISAEVDFYLSFDGDVGGEVGHNYGSELPIEQLTYADIASGKNLVGKIAGNDPIGQHKDWSTELVGWDAHGAASPESLVRLWVAQLDALAVARASGEVPLDPTGAPVGPVYVTAQGIDLRQLIEKFLSGAVAFSQGADDYLDDDVEGKGLLADHLTVEEGTDHTALEHAWDEGFGYFGAARGYGGWSLDTIADGERDDDGSGSIDLLSEVSYGHSANAAKRDRDAVVATDLVGRAWQGFVLGRAVLDQADSALTAREFDELRGYRNQAVLAWEEAIAASAVHYINEVLRDTGAIGTEGYSFASHAKHWSELKGFALSFQFNPRSPMTDADFAELHALIGMAPAIDGDTQAYRTALLDARDLIGATYGFHTANLGDDDGQHGW